MADLTRLAAPRRRYQRAHRLVAALICAALSAVLVAEHFRPDSLLESLRVRYFDRAIANQTMPADYAEDVVLVDIDNASIEAYGQWPWRRAQLADVFRAMSAAGVKTVAANIVLSEPDRLGRAALSEYLNRELGPGARIDPARLPDTDAVLAAAMAEAPTVLSIAAAASPRADPRPATGGVRSRAAISASQGPPRFYGLPGVIRNLPPFQEVAIGAGVIAMFSERDGVLRRGPTAFQVQGRIIPAFALEATRAHLDADAIMFSLAESGAATAVRLEGRMYGVDGLGRVWAPFASTRITRVSASQLLSGDADVASLSGKLAFLGVSADGVGDRYTVAGGGDISAAEAHAVLAAALLADRAAFRPDAVIGAETAVGVLLAASLTLLGAFGLVYVAIGTGVLAPIAAWAAAESVLTTGQVLVDPLFIGAVGLTAAMVWTIFLLLKQRLQLIHERAFVGRTVGLMTEGLAITDSEGMVRAANPAAERMLGHDAASLDARPPQTLPGVDEVLSRLQVKTFPAEDPAAPPVTLEIESTWRRDGAETVGVHLIRDVTEMRAAQADADLAAERLAQATAGMADGLALYDAAGALRFHNPAFASLIAGDASAVLTGETYDALMRRLTAKADERGQAFHRRIAALARRPLQEEEMETHGGGWLLARERATPRGGIAAVYTDISLLKQTEQHLRDARIAAEAATGAKDRMLASLSHEMRTPLNAIIGFADVMRSGVFGDIGNDRYRAYIDNVLVSGRELLSLIETLLEFAAAEAKETAYQMEPVDLEPAVREHLKMFEALASGAGVEIAVSATTGIPPCRLDRSALRRILTNLTSNSLKHTGQGGRIEISISHSSAEGHAIVVADTGSGMTKAEADRAFDPFWRGAREDEESAPGVGLGLALVKSMVEAQGGAITLHTAVGAGLSVHMAFPPPERRAPSTRGPLRT